MELSWSEIQRQASRWPSLSRQSLDGTGSYQIMDSGPEKKEKKEAETEERGGCDLNMGWDCWNCSSWPVPRSMGGGYASAPKHDRN